MKERQTTSFALGLSILAAPKASKVCQTDAFPIGLNAVSHSNSSGMAHVMRLGDHVNSMLGKGALWFLKCKSN
jgi:hypothetical protein